MNVNNNRRNGDLKPENNALCFYPVMKPTGRVNNHTCGDYVEISERSESEKRRGKKS